MENSEEGKRYDTDLSDERWEIIERLIAGGKIGGRRSEKNIGEVMNEISTLEDRLRMESFAA